MVQLPWLAMAHNIKCRQTAITSVQFAANHIHRQPTSCISTISLIYLFLAFNIFISNSTEKRHADDVGAPAAGGSVSNVDQLFSPQQYQNNYPSGAAPADGSGAYFPSGGANYPSGASAGGTQSLY